MKRTTPLLVALGLFLLLCVAFGVYDIVARVTYKPPASTITIEQLAADIKAGQVRAVTIGGGYVVDVTFQNGRVERAPIKDSTEDSFSALMRGSGVTNEELLNLVIQHANPAATDNLVVLGETCLLVPGLFVFLGLLLFAVIRLRPQS